MLKTCEAGAAMRSSVTGASLQAKTARLCCQNNSGMISHWCLTAQLSQVLAHLAVVESFADEDGKSLFSLEIRLDKNLEPFQSW